MRLDHLLSKEHRDAERHHEPASIERIEGVAQGWNIDKEIEWVHSQVLLTRGTREMNSKSGHAVGS